jgi:hypothetical protein
MKKCSDFQRPTTGRPDHIDRHNFATAVCILWSDETAHATPITLWFHGEEEIQKAAQTTQAHILHVQLSIMTSRSALNEYCQQLGLPKPEYELIQQGDQGPFRCILTVSGVAPVEAGGKPTAVARDWGIACTAEGKAICLL